MRFHFIIIALIWFQGFFLLASPQPAALEITETTAPWKREETEKLILHFEFEAALENLRACNDPYAKAYYLNHILFYKVFATEDGNLKKLFFENCDQALSIFEKMDKKSPYRKYYEGEIYFLRGIILFMSKKQLSAGWDINKAFNRIKANQLEHPAFIPNYKIIGLFEAGFGAVPEKYQYLTNFLGFKGDIHKGIEKMRIASRNSELFPQEAQLLLHYAERKLLNNVDLALSGLTKMLDNEPDNILFTYVFSNIAVNDKRSQEAIPRLEKIIRQKNNKKIFYIYFIDYLYGKACFYQLRYPEASNSLDLFIKGYKGTNFVVDAMFRKALIYELQGDHITAKKLFLEITNLSKNDFDLDNYAIRYAPIFAEKPFSPDELLLQKARNQFDGGFFAEASSTLQPLFQKITQLPAETALELNYRMGRIAHEQKQGVKAKTYYQLAMLSKLTPEHPALWMKVYATYYLGNLFEIENQTADASIYYSKALQFKNYQYSNDLEQMARAGLERVKKKSVGK